MKSTVALAAILLSIAVVTRGDTPVSITGVVRNYNQAPLEGIWVAVVSDGDIVTSTKTNAKGEYEVRFAALPKVDLIFKDGAYATVITSELGATRNLIIDKVLTRRDVNERP
jgi:hypothetical protein